jgi:hypothetical protein
LDEIEEETEWQGAEGDGTEALDIFRAIAGVRGFLSGVR